MLARVLAPHRVLDAIRKSAFRWFILGRMAGASTGQMRVVVQGWLVYQMTGSALALGWVSAARSVVTLLIAPYGGVLSDRFEKRWVMLGARIVLILMNLTIVLLILFNVLQPWHIVVAAVVEGIAFSFLDPAQNMIIAELVDRETLLNAVSVTSIFEGVMSIAGAALAGLMIRSAGAGSVFLMLSGLYCFSAYTILHLPKGLSARGRRSFHADLAAGFNYLRSSQALKVLLSLAFVYLIFMQPYQSFLPAYARRDLGFDAAGLGLLTACAGVGSLLSSLLLASVGDPSHKGKLLVVSGIAGTLSAVLFLAVRSSPAPFILIALATAFSTLVDLVARTLLQSSSEPGYRGRVYSLMMVMTGLTGLSVLPAGVLADQLGVPVVVGSLALLALSACVVVAVRRSDFLRLR